MSYRPRSALSAMTLLAGALFLAGMPVAVCAATDGAKMCSPSASDYLSREEVQTFLKDVNQIYGIPLEWLQDEVAVARHSEPAERLMTPKPGKKKPGTDIVKPPFRNFLTYVKSFLSEERIQRGQDFLVRNADAFKAAESRTGVPRHVVAAVIGVETFYGRNMGRHRVLDTLMTLSFDYTRRAAYFKDELGHFLDFCWRQNVSPITIQGSYAGAIGYGQFMPSSLDRWGTDGDNDGRIDLIGNEADAVASVANFLHAHGWVAGRGLLYPVEASEEIFDATGSGGIAAHTTVASLKEAGVKFANAFPLPDDEPVLLVDLPQLTPAGRKTVKWYVGTRNFSSVLRYNRSYFYASAVSMLAERLSRSEIASDISQQQPVTTATPFATEASADTAGAH